MPEKAFSKEEFMRAIGEYSKGKPFVLNPDAGHVAAVVDGVYTNLEKKGFKFCPCRLTTGDFEKDKDLLCPCNFEIQKAWKDWNRCWCGLYVKK